MSWKLKVFVLKNQENKNKKFFKSGTISFVLLYKESWQFGEKVDISFRAFFRIKLEWLKRIKVVSTILMNLFMAVLWNFILKNSNE